MHPTGRIWAAGSRLLEAEAEGTSGLMKVKDSGAGGHASLKLMVTFLFGKQPFILFRDMEMQRDEPASTSVPCSCGSGTLPQGTVGHASR